MFTYIPKKSKEIYNSVIAHRGYHCYYPENTIKSYIEAIKHNMAIELDIRMTKDGYIICMHDRYTKRLLGKKGKTSNMTLNEIKKYKIKNSNETIPLLEDVLKVVKGNVPLLIEVKGYLNNRFNKKLFYYISNYDGKVYFHAKNMITYFILRSIWMDKVFYVLNPFRKRFNFIKAKYYKNKLLNNYGLNIS